MEKIEHARAARNFQEIGVDHDSKADVFFRAPGFFRPPQASAFFRPPDPPGIYIYMYTALYVHSC